MPVVSRIKAGSMRALEHTTDAVLFGYALSWLVISGAALASPEVGGVYAAASYGTASVAFILATWVRVKAGAEATARALARLVLLYGVGVITNMGEPWRLLDAAGAMPVLTAVGAAGGAVGDTVTGLLYLWLPVRTLWLKFAALLHFTAIYPRPLMTASTLRRTLGRAGLLWGVALCVSLGWAFIDMWAPVVWQRVATWISTGLLAVAGALVLANVAAAFRSASEPEQGRIAGVLAAVALGLTGEMLMHLWPVPLLGSPPALVSVLHIAAPIGACLLAVYAVFVRGGLSPELMLRRTAVYGLLSVSGLFTFSVLDELLSSLLVTKLGLPEGLVSAVALAAVAVVFKPVYDRLSRRLSALLEHRLGSLPAATVEHTPDDALSVPPA